MGPTVSHGDADFALVPGRLGATRLIDHLQRDEVPIPDMKVLVMRTSAPAAT
ncbi:MAG TPA: hypothetical protein VNV17_12505 [Solirubrobacteraceae bacterium]|nr:hypothetical protein [Solirubrobacteraceae bacterium]